jgi:selenocysteine-specific elongation factor
VENILIMVREYHKKFPVRLGIPKAEISNKVKLGKHFQDTLQKLFSEGLLVEESSLARLPDFQVKLTPAQQLQINTYLKQLNINPYSPAPDIPIEPDLINLLIDRKEVIKTTAGVIFSTTAFNEMVLKVHGQIEKTGKITVAEARDSLGSSRKYVLALLEHLDELKLTKRVGDERVAGEKG